MNEFDQALKFALVWEGGDKITDDPDDAGGLTKYGISKRAHPELDIVNLTEEQAAQIYRDEYWITGGCDSLPSPVNRVHFDACVNHGIRNANKFLQRSAGVADDGRIGPITLSAVQSMDPHLLAIAMISERNRFYQSIVDNNASQAKYLRGWLNRTKALMDSI
mgnify:CR=1 FL=1